MQVAFEREERDQILVSERALLDVMAYDEPDVEAVRKVKAIALQVLADMIETGEEVPAPRRVLFAA